MEFSPLADLAFHYLNHTREIVFLTGKAGSGKTTFLKYLAENSYKNTAIVAPTGIAAINAGGVSMHSLFQMPIFSFIPFEVNPIPQITGRRFHTRKTLLSEQRIGASKRSFLRNLELLIIDEVSMLRADLLDSIDAILRHIRNNRNQAFGGVQVLFIGDLNQLPPIVSNEEWEVLSNYYQSIFFFDALVLKSKKLVHIELDKIYRQNDPQFIDILNRLRNNELDNNDITKLNKHYQAGFAQKGKADYIYITTHNQKAEQINTEALEQLPNPSYSFKAVVKDDFPENLYPCSHELTLKKGAQVMFIKNDTGGKPRYYNGKIGKVVEITEEKIGILTEEGKIIYPAPYVWENKRYTIDKKTEEPIEEIIGTFTQYPLKLAWSITVHKSQGLTFERAILDLAGSFAAGQMYVALSRLTSLKGLILASLIPQKNLSPDRSLIAFNQKKPTEKHLKNEFLQSRSHYLSESAIKAFDFSAWLFALKKHLESFDKEENLSTKQKYQTWTLELQETFAPLQITAEKFHQQINQIAKKTAAEKLPKQLFERIEKAKSYFLPLLHEIVKKMKSHKQTLLGKTQVKTYLQELTELIIALVQHKKNIIKTYLIFQSTVEGWAMSKEILQKNAEYKAENDLLNEIQNATRIPTQVISLQLFKAGKNIDEIAKIRELTPQTIEEHLVYWIEAGQVSAFAFISQKDFEAIAAAAQKLQTEKLSPIKELLDKKHQFSYSQIRIAIAHLRHLKEQATEF